MRFVDEFRDRELAQTILARIHEAAGRLQEPVRLMEVCGTHTVALFRHGIHALLPEQVRLLSGPGCPVCVTPTAEIDAAISLARQPQTVLATFGDMMRVPGRESTLLKERAAGRQVLVVYSPLDALKAAQKRPDHEVVLFGVGFETTAPLVASTALQAQQRGLRNFSVYSAHKLVPPALAALVAADDVRVDGFICPGHVSTVIGSQPYEFIPRDHGRGCVIAGFEPLDVLEAIWRLLRQIELQSPQVEIAYRRAVRPEGNPEALKRLSQAFVTVDAEWRGLGTIRRSGLEFREELSAHNAKERFDIQTRPVADPPGCLCGEVLRGAREPEDCAHFGTTCTPEQPVGPCMVSSEGTCAAHYRYGEAGRRVEA